MTIFIAIAPPAAAGPGRSHDVRALIDTGASMSMIRNDLALEHGLTPHRRIDLANFGGTRQCDIYSAVLVFKGGHWMELELAGGDFEHTDTQFLIGRDLLMHAVLTLNGPLGRFEIEFNGPGIQVVD